MKKFRLLIRDGLNGKTFVSSFVFFVFGLSISVSIGLIAFGLNGNTENLWWISVLVFLSVWIWVSPIFD